MRPKQRVSNTEKNTKDHKESSYKYFSDLCSNKLMSTSKLESLYRLANGDLDETDYTYITDPYKGRAQNRPELTGFPAKMRNYDIISPNLLQLVSEYGGRDFVFDITNLFSDIPAKRQAFIEAKIKENMFAMFRQELAAQGLSEEEEQQEIQSYQAILQESLSIMDEVAIDGKNILDYIIYDQSLARKYREAFYDFIVCSRAFSYKEPDFKKDRLKLKTLSPFGFSWAMSQDTTFIKDGIAAKYETSMSVTEVLDTFQDILDKDQVNAIEAMVGNNEGSTRRAMVYSDAETNFLNKFSSQYSPDSILVEHTVWRATRKIGYVTGLQEDGSIKRVKVLESYKPMFGEEVEWEWEDEIWEGYNIAGLFRVGIQPIEYLTGEKAELPYNGRIFHNRSQEPKSIAQKGYEFQVSYNIIKYTVEKLVAKNKDKVSIIPLGLIPEKEGHDEFTTLYYMDAAGVLFVDETSEKASVALQALKVLDLSLSQFINNMVGLAQSVKIEWDEMIGMFRQRKGNVQASDAVGTTERAIFQGSIMTEEVMTQFDEFRTNDYQSILDLSQVAFKKGVTKSYRTTDLMEHYINISEDSDFPHAKLGLFVTSSSKLKERMDTIKGLMQPYAQNAGSMSTIVDIINTDSISKVVNKIKKFEKEMQEAQAQEQQAAQAAAQAAIQAESELKMAEIESRERIAMDKNAVELEKARMAIEGTLIGQDLNNNKVDDSKEIIEGSLKREELRIKDKEIAVKANTEKYKADTSLKIAKENKNKHDSK